MNKPLKRLGIEGIEQRMERSNPRDAWASQTGFNVFALGDWLQLCEQVGIAHVPATRVATVAVEKLLQFDVPPADPDLVAFFAAAEAAKQPNTILRWDACAPEIVKHRLSKGSPEWDAEILEWFTIDDPRAFDILYAYPDGETSVWSRPWVTAAICENYPIEYRVFVHNGDLVGVSNYYVQRPLCDAVGDPLGGVQHDVSESIALTERLAEALPIPIRFGTAAQRVPSDSRSFTADFMRLKSGELVFLEAGPPFGAGAHPCCFPVDFNAWADIATWQIKGIPVALAALKGSPELEIQDV